MPNPKIDWVAVGQAKTFDEFAKITGVERLKPKPITPEEFRNRMETISENYDVECGHSDMDDLMCEVLRSLGYGEGVDIFEKAEKWYA
jgi:hypothetical protein